MALKKPVHEEYRIPGAKLYELSQRVLSAMEDGELAYLSHAIDFISFMDGGRGASHTVAAATRASPHYTYTRSLYLATNWLKDSVPELGRMIARGQNSEEVKAREAAQELQEELENILSNPIYGGDWAIRLN